MEVHCRVVIIPFQKGFAPDIWSQETDVVLEKSLGVPGIHRLRVIQLIEADLNQCILMLFTRSMVHIAGMTVASCPMVHYKPKLYLCSLRQGHQPRVFQAIPHTYSINKK